MGLKQRPLAAFQTHFQLGWIWKVDFAPVPPCAAGLQGSKVNIQSCCAFSLTSALLFPTWRLALLTAQRRSLADFPQPQTAPPNLPLPAPLPSARRDSPRSTVIKILHGLPWPHSQAFLKKILGNMVKREIQKSPAP